MNSFFNAVSKTESEVYKTALILEGDGAGEHALYIEGEPQEGAYPYFLERKDYLADPDTVGTVTDGDRKVFVESVGRPAEMVICGGGHVAVQVVKLAKMVGFHVTVYEDRPLFANNARAAGADVVSCMSFEDNLAKTTGGPNVYFLILTRGHRFDMVCLRDLLKKPYAYIGMIGSRVRVRAAKETLLEEGYPAEKLDSLHSPIGLKIGAETPEELAVSILAEIIDVRSKERKSGGYTKAMLEALRGEQNLIVATIIERRGSAPRKAGTKMMILEDGRCIGTIGGGCAENDVIMKARYMLQDEEAEQDTVMVDMTGREAEDEGMVCGGRIKVFMEKVHVR
ncbi:MAG: XdhC family protein [Lachnospiraceae bacterium]|nr:XdhC family protein [Lachnospiraceae bacterium]